MSDFAPTMPASIPSIYRSVFFWLVLVIALSQLANAAVALSNPLAFAERLGSPLANPDDTGFVYVYAFRAGFIGLLALGLLATRNIQALFVMSLAAIVMPLGDALLTYSTGAPPATVLKHVGYVIYVSAMAIAIRVWLNKHGANL
jgi:hypothetical protein